MMKTLYLKRRWLWVLTIETQYAWWRIRQIYADYEKKRRYTWLDKAMMYVGYGVVTVWVMRRLGLIK